MPADIVSKAVRSRMMSGIRGRDTRPERRLRKQLFAAGFRFRLNRRDLPGRPDIVLPRYRAVMFVHGCFWHRHTNCRFATTPATNVEFWQQKFRRNQERDEESMRALRDIGWKVAIVWECVIGASGLDDARFSRLRYWLVSHAASADSASRRHAARTLVLA